jgi:hypothetical protein
MNTNRMVISATAHNATTTVEIPWDSNIHAVFDAFYTLAIGMGFANESWEDAVLQAAEDIEDERRDNTRREEEDAVLAAASKKTTSQPLEELLSDEWDSLHKYW